MKHWEVEKAFMNTVYHGIVMLAFGLITVGTSMLEGAHGAVCFFVSSALFIWRVFLFSVHASGLCEVVAKYDEENK